MILSRLLALALVFVTMLTVAPAIAADLDTYRASLTAANAALNGGDPDVESALSHLHGVEPVTLDNGTVVTPDLTLVIETLEADPPDVAPARAGIEAILAALDLAEAGAVTDPERAQTALDAVLAREEFQPAPEDDAPVPLWQRLLDRVGSAIDSFFDWIDRLLGGNGEGRSPVSIALALIGVLVVAGIVAFAVRSVRESMTPGVTRLTVGSPEDRYTSAQARAEAEWLFAAGEYRAALRLLYLATLIRWEEAGRLRFDRSLTNREVVARVNRQGDASLLEQLSPLVDRFDRVWYGGAPCTADDYLNFAALAERAWEVA